MNLQQRDAQVRLLDQVLAPHRLPRYIDQTGRGGGSPQANPLDLMDFVIASVSGVTDPMELEE